MSGALIVCIDVTFSAVHGLARLRKLVNPKVAEITLIERQLNVAAERVGGDS